MTGIDYRKIAEISEGKGHLKKAADYYAQAGDLKKAYTFYEKILSKTSDRDTIRDIEIRLKKLGAPENLRKLASAANARSLERYVGAALSILSLAAALFFISLNATGNSIGNLSRDGLSLLGIGLFILGLMAFVFFKSRKK